MKVITGRSVPLCFLYDRPAFVYIFRQWFNDPVDGQSTCSKIVIFKTQYPKTPNELFAEIEDSLGTGVARAMHLIDVEVGSNQIELDTWEPEVDCVETIGIPSGVHIYKNWWSADNCVEIFGDDLEKS